ncbi:methyltransferase domain-containing protein [Pseudonocardia sp. DLS-67]
MPAHRRASATRFVDLACGTGSLVVEAARRGADAHGVDVAEEMLAYTREAGGRRRGLRVTAPRRVPLLRARGPARRRRRRCTSCAGFTLEESAFPRPTHGELVCRRR